MASQVKFPQQEDDKDMFGSPAPMSDVGESSSSKFWRKMKEQPLVPIGSFATCGALIAASHYLRTGNRENFQRALRWRVGLQGLTVVAAVIGTVYLGSGSPAAPTETNGTIATQPGRPATVSQTAKLEERKAEERAQLQARLREAELREEQEEKRRAEQVLMAGSRTDASQYNRSRPNIGQDRRDRGAATAAQAAVAQQSPAAEQHATAEGTVSRALRNLSHGNTDQRASAANVKEDQRRMV